MQGPKGRAAPKHNGILIMLTQFEGIIDLTFGRNAPNRNLYGEIIHTDIMWMYRTVYYANAIGNSIREELPPPVIVDCWAICGAHERQVFIRHIHHKSELACATTYVDKLEWMCYVCGEEVPKGILFMARTERLG